MVRDGDGNLLGDDFGDDINLRCLYASELVHLLFIGGVLIPPLFRKMEIPLEFHYQGSQSKFNIEMTITTFFILLTLGHSTLRQSPFLLTSPPSVFPALRLPSSNSWQDRFPPSTPQEDSPPSQHHISPVIDHLILPVINFKPWTSRDKLIYGAYETQQRINK